MNWYTIYVNSRAEKKVSERLQHRGFETFCPMETQIRQWSDRKKKVAVPYFPSYVFVKCNEQQRSEIAKVGGVVSFVFWLSKPAVIREEEMEEVQRFFSRYKDEKIECFDPGQRLKVKTGAFQNKTGVLCRQDKNSVSIELEQIGLAVKVTLPKANVARV